MKTISSVGEFGLIRQITQSIKLNKNVLVGPGDDCAVVKIGVKKILLTTDLLLEGIHFKKEWMTAKDIGVKAMRVNLSDIAAMGGEPLYALVSVAMPASCSIAYVRDLFSGLKKAAEEADCVIVGGDTNAGDRIVLNIAVVSEAVVGSGGGRFLTRSGAKVGDVLYVTGELGGSALGLEALRRKKRGTLDLFIQKHIRPPLRTDVGRTLARLSGVHAMIDVSDGLAGDLGHILERSGVGAEVAVDHIPVPKGFDAGAKALRVDPVKLKLSGGEDYELLFTASPRVKMPQKIHGIPVTKIGRIIDKRKGLRFIDSRGKALKALKGFQHF